MTTDCFRTLSNELINVTHLGDTPCGSTSNGFSQCCGKGDQCLEDGICHLTHGGVGTSGYYVASCTDESGKDSSCLQSCNGNAEPDIVYSEADTLWHCCEVYSDTGTPDTGTPNCSAPTNETFQAPAPEKLADFASTSTSASPGKSSSSRSSLPSSPSSSTTQSSPIANNVSPTPTSSSTPNSNSGLSTGAKAGIGVGVALGAVCIVLLSIIIFLMRKRERRQQETVLPGDESKGTQEEGNGGKDTTEIQRPPEDRQSWYELHEQAMNSELDPSRGAFHEIES